MRGFLVVLSFILFNSLSAIADETLATQVNKNLVFDHRINIAAGTSRTPLFYVSEMDCVLRHDVSNENRFIDKDNSYKVVSATYREVSENSFDEMLDSATDFRGDFSEKVKSKDQLKAALIALGEKSRLYYVFGPKPTRLLVELKATPLFGTLKLACGSVLPKNFTDLNIVGLGIFRLEADQ